MKKEKNCTFIHCLVLSYVIFMKIYKECLTTWAASTTVGPDRLTRGSDTGTANL